MAITPLETRPTLSPELRGAFEASLEQHEVAYRRLAGYQVSRYLSLAKVEALHIAVMERMSSHPSPFHAGVGAYWNLP